MCRFLLCKSQDPLRPAGILAEFAERARDSIAPDGSLQEDGWGIAWLDARHQWRQYRSLLPVWQETSRFCDFPETTVFAVHARSASFENQKNILEFTQPFVSQTHAFVFNGLLRGVSLATPGEIGAQKIWRLLQSLLRKFPAAEAMAKTREVLQANSREIQALNMGVADANGISALSFHTAHPEYYQLHEIDLPEIRIISSVRLHASLSNGSAGNGVGCNALSGARSTDLS